MYFRVLSEKPRSCKFYVVSMIFHQETFYTVDDDCSLFVHSGFTEFFNDNSGTTKTSMKTWPWPVKENKVASTFRHNDVYFHECFIQLLKSINGELMMVERIFDEESYITKSFNVFKLTLRGSYKKKYWESDNNDYKYYWKEIDRLDNNEALYLGWNDSISVSVNNSYDHNIQSYKPNCIYFFDESVNYKLCNYGIYDLESRSIQLWKDYANDDDYDPYDSENEEEIGPSFCRLFVPSTYNTS